MFRFILASSNRDLVFRQLPAFAISFAIASVFYKFGSFALECLAFLVTWFLVDGLASLFHRQTLAGEAEPPSSLRQDM